MNQKYFRTWLFEFLGRSEVEKVSQVWILTFDPVNLFWRESEISADHEGRPANSPRRL